MPALYVLERSDYAKPFNPTQKLYRSGPRIEHLFGPERKPDAVGLAGLVLFIRKLWGSAKAGLEALKPPIERSFWDTSGHDLDTLAKAAVCFNTARELWGWGSVAPVAKLQLLQAANVEPETWSELVKFRHAHLLSDWTVAQKSILCEEFERRKARPVLNANQN